MTAAKKKKEERSEATESAGERERERERERGLKGESDLLTRLVIPEGYKADRYEVVDVDVEVETKKDGQQGLQNLVGGVEEAHCSRFEANSERPFLFWLRHRSHRDTDQSFLGAWTDHHPGRAYRIHPG